MALKTDMLTNLSENNLKRFFQVLGDINLGKFEKICKNLKFPIFNTNARVMYLNQKNNHV